MKRSSSFLSPLIAAALLFGCDRDESADNAPETLSPAEAATDARGVHVDQPKPLVLVDTTYLKQVDLDSLTEGMRGELRADLDGDGGEETITVYARVALREEEPMWDDGQPWFVTIDNAAGERTVVYAGWVQLGHLEAGISAPDSGGHRSLVLLKHEGSGITAYRVSYLEPGTTYAEMLMQQEVMQYVPVEAWRREEGMYRDTLAGANPVGAKRES